MTTDTDTFASPGTAAGLNFEALKGRLLLIIPSSLEAGIPTTFGDKEAVRADVAVLDGSDAGTEYADTLIFPKALIGQLRNRISQRVLGRLGQGNAKPGQKPPWLLTEATEDDKKVGLAYLAGTLTSPARDNDKPPF